MNITLLLDHHLGDRAPFFQAGLREIGWDDLLKLEFLCLHDVGLPHDHPDNLLWRFVQERHIWLVTSNRNSNDETSLQATIERENTMLSLPVLTLPGAHRLGNAAFRQRVVARLVDILIAPERHCGLGRIFLS